MGRVIPEPPRSSRERLVVALATVGGVLLLGGVAAVVLMRGSAPETNEKKESQARASGQASMRQETVLLVMTFSNHVQNGQRKEALAALEKLIGEDPSALADYVVGNEIATLAVQSSAQDPSEAERLFQLISTRMGATGPDILFTIMRQRGGSQAAERAAALLADDAVRARGTKEMRIAYDLWQAKSCEQRAALYGRAGEEGDGRALGRLQMTKRECGESGELERAIEAIKDRLDAQQPPPQGTKARP